MGEWLFKEDEYTPKEDKDKFIDKSILGMISILSNIKRAEKDRYSHIYSLNAAIKLSFTLLFLILISLSRSYIYIGVIDLYILVAISMLDVEDMKKVIGLSLIIPIFTLIMLIPSIIMGNVRNSLLIVIKVFSAVSLVNMLSYTTKWSNITKALKQLHIPDIFILTMEITIRYIYLLGDFSLNLLYALRLRSVGRNNKKYGSIAEIMGTLFIRSKNMGDEMYSAMECRGFTGEYTSFSTFKFKRGELIYSIVGIGLIAAFFFL